MKKEGEVVAPFRKKLFAALINLLFFLLVGFIIDYTLMPVTYKRWMGHDTIEQNCIVLNDSYRDKQDEYGIYYYNEDDKRVYNDNVSEETLTAFRNDEEVRNIASSLSSEQTKLYIIDISSFGVAFLFVSLFLTILTVFVLGRYKSFGALCIGLWTYTEELEKPKWSTYLGYACLRWLLLIPLGICSIFMIPVVFLYQLYYDDDHRTKLEKKFHLLVVEKR